MLAAPGPREAPVTRYGSISNDDSRGNESPDRQNAQSQTNDESIRTHLETLDELTTILLEALHDPTTRIGSEPVSQQTRREARRHCREIRAETAQLGLLLYGPEASIPYHPEGSPAGLGWDTAGATVYSGPEPEAFERERQRQRGRDECDADAGSDREADDADASDSNYTNADDAKADAADADGDHTNADTDSTEDGGETDD